MITKKERPEMLISIQSGEGKNGKPSFFVTPERSN